MTQRLLDAMTWKVDGTEGTPPPGDRLADFLERARRLPTTSRSYSFHGCQAGTPPDPQLLVMLRPLQGRFAVVNPALVVALPERVRRRAERSVRAAAARVGALRAPLARDAGGGVTVALLESVDHAVRRVRTAALPGDARREARFAGTVRYRLVVALGELDETTVADAPARHLSRPVHWFDIALLVPDAEALRQMDEETRHYYRRVTGRMGDPSRDSYWFADAWERYHEPGRVAGCIDPAGVSHPLAGRPPADEPRDEDPAAAEEAFLYGPTAGEHSQWGRYDPDWERRMLIPPGYCLIRYACQLEIAIAGPVSRSMAA